MEQEHNLPRRLKHDGTIHKRADGRYQGKMRLKLKSSGKSERFAVYGKTKGEVNKELRKLRQRYEQELSPADMTLEQWFEKWWETGEKKSTTYRDRRLNIDRINPIIGGMLLAEIRITDIIKVSETLKKTGGRKGTGLSASSRKQALAILRKALSVAFNQDYIDRNPFDKWDKDNTPKVVQRSQKLLSMEQQVALLAFQDGWTPLWIIQLVTGNRSGETLALTWDDLDLPDDPEADGIMRVTKSIHKRNKNTRALPNWLDSGDSYYLDKTKTQKNKTLHLPPSIVEVFRDIKLSQEKERERLGSAYLGKGFVFTRKHQTEPVFDKDSNPVGHRDIGGYPVVPESAYYALKRSLKKAGLSHVRVHDLRHTYITDQYNAGVLIASISKMVAHSSTAFTMDVYGHLTEEVESKASGIAAKRIEEARDMGKAKVEAVPNAS